MSSVDDRIVNMKFNNSQFTQGAAQSEKSLSSLEQTLANTAKSKGMSALGASVEGVKSRFSALQVAGVTALATIANRATNVGINLVKSFTIDPIKAGLESYNEQINATQVILANTKAQGTTLKDVTATLKDLQQYANLTVYSFADMTTNIGRFTAAGVPLKNAQAAIKGMANVAALSGANTQQMSSAMYQMSQALSTGVLRLQDWNSLANANMGGQNIQKAIEETARTMGDQGKTMDANIQKFGSFRQSLQSGWLTADIYSKTMKVFGGTIDKSTGQMHAFSVEQIKQMGYSETAAKSLHTLSQDALNSATKIRTIPQLMQALREEVATQWGQVFKAIFGNINQATSLFSSLHTTIENGLTNPLKSFVKLLDEWGKKGGRAAALDGIRNIFEDLGKVLSSVREAFKEVFPPATANTLVTISKKFDDFTKKLTPSKSVLMDLKNIFAGLFAVIHIGVTVISAFHALFMGLLEGIFKGSGPASHGILDMLGSLGKFLVTVDKFVSHGGKLVDLFHNIGKAAGTMVGQGIALATNLIAGIIKGLDGRALEAAVVKIATNIIDWIKGALGIHSPAAALVPVGSNVVLGIVSGMLKAIPALLSGLGKVIAAVFKGFGSLFKGFTATDFASLINAIFTAGLLLTINRFAGSMNDFVVNLQSLGHSFKEVFEEAGKTLKTFQQEIKAKALEAIAIAVALLVASLIALSLIKSGRLAKGLGAVGALLGMLTASLFSLSKINKGKDAQSLTTMAASLVAIGLAINEFAIAIAFLGHLKPETLAKGLGAIALVLGSLIATVKSMSGLGKGVVSGAAAMVLMAGAIDVLVLAVTAFGLLPTKVLVKGFAALAVGLLLMTTAMVVLSASSKSAIAGATAMVLVAGAMTVLAGAVLAFGKMDFKTLAKGFGAIALGLLLFTAALVVLSANSAGTIAAAGAIALMSVAIAAMVPVITTLGGMSWSSLIKGIVGMAAVVAIFVVAILALGGAAEEVAPGLLVLGAAIALVGVGMLAFGTGFALMAATGTAGVAVLVVAIHAFLALLPEIAVQIASAFVAFLKVIANATTPIRKAFDKIFSNMIGVISDNIPKIVNLVVEFISKVLGGIRKLIPQYGKVISTLIKTGLQIITKAIPQYVTAGLKIILGVLQGLDKNLPKIIAAGGDLIVSFIKGLGKQGARIVNATGKTILEFLTGLDKAINKYEPRIIAEGVKIGADLIRGAVKGLTSAVSLSSLSSAIGSTASHIISGFKARLHINSPSKDMIPIGQGVGEGMAAGIRKSISLSVAAAVQMANAIIAEGNKAVLAAQRIASKQEAAAAAAKTRADIAQKEAKAAEKHANEVSKRKGATKAEKKAANMESARAKKHAADLAKIANQASKASDRATTHVQNVQAFQQADDTGKGDILSAHATDLADKANKKLADANAEAAQARKVMKTNRKLGLELLRQSKADAREAKDLADKARKDNAEADKYYAKAVDARIKQMKKAADADAKAKADEAAYNAADDAGKQKILNDRAATEQAAADAANKKAADYIARAKKLAKTDAKKAQHLLDLADAQTQIAKDQADAAAQDKQQAADLVSQASNEVSSISGSTGTSLTPSQAILQDAASTVDRYTKSLLEAEVLAASTDKVIQFTQNNTSPVALTPSEVYRQTKNLLAVQGAKLGASGVVQNIP